MVREDFGKMLGMDLRCQNCSLGDVSRVPVENEEQEFIDAIWVKTMEKAGEELFE